MKLTELNRLRKLAGLPLVESYEEDDIPMSADWNTVLRTLKSKLTPEQLVLCGLGPQGRQPDQHGSFEVQNDPTEEYYGLVSYHPDTSDGMDDMDAAEEFEAFLYPILNSLKVYIQE